MHEHFNCRDGDVRGNNWKVRFDVQGDNSKTLDLLGPHSRTTHVILKT